MNLKLMILILILKGKRAIPIQLYIFNFVVREFFGHLSGIYSKAMVVFRYNLVYWHLIFCKYITSVV